MGQAYVRSTPRSTGRRDSGFTLIEVLVVVAIIALLVAILLPSLKSARNQAQAAVCASNMNQAIKGALVHLAETNMRKERWSTNFGWATQSLKANGGQSELFTCPADTHPRPTAAVLMRLYDGANGYHGTTAGDGIFNHCFDAKGGIWQTDIQDSVEGNEFGGDATRGSDIDLMIGYTATTARQRFGDGYIAEKEAGWHFDVLSYKGELLWQNAMPGSGNRVIPILWMSYGANASSGLKNIKGIPAFVVEAGKPGIFAEDLYKGSERVVARENLRRPLRFRHGGKNKDAEMWGWDYTDRSGYMTKRDMKYEAATTMNVGYIDGHVQRLNDGQMMIKDANPLTAPIPNGQVWFGGRRGGIASFD